MTHTLEASPADFEGVATTPVFNPTPKTGLSDADSQKPPRKPRISPVTVVKLYRRGMWALAFAAIYGLLVFFQLAGSIHGLLLANGQLSSNNVVTLIPLRYQGQTFCLYETPASVSFPTLLYAINPLNWGSRLTAYINATYCGKSYTQLNVAQSPFGPAAFQYNLTNETPAYPK